MRIVIQVSIVKSQYQRRAPVLRAHPSRRIEFFQRFFQVEHAIMPPQVEQMTTQVSTARTMVIENNQIWFCTLHQPARQSYQPTIIEKCSNNYTSASADLAHPPLWISRQYTKSIFIYRHIDHFLIYTLQKTC